MRNTESFKSAIQKETEEVPSYYYTQYTGRRLPQILHTRLRLQNSDLNKDLHDRSIIESPSCACGYPTEDAHHYLLDCLLYTNLRIEMLDSLPNLDYVRVRDLLRGNKNLSDEENIQIFINVQKYIMETDRFA